MKNVAPGDVVRVAVENAKGRNKVVVDYDELLNLLSDAESLIYNASFKLSEIEAKKEQ